MIRRVSLLLCYLLVILSTADNICKKDDVRIKNGYAYIYEESWEPICGHYFWDNNVGATAFCKKLGYKIAFLGKPPQYFVDRYWSEDAEKIAPISKSNAKHIGKCDDESEFPTECHKENYTKCSTYERSHLTKITCYDLLKDSTKIYNPGNQIEQNCIEKETILEKQIESLEKKLNDKKVRYKYEGDIRSPELCKPKNDRKDKNQLTHVKLKNGDAYIWDTWNAWKPICGHYFWNNNIGATNICQLLGYEHGEIKKVDEQDFGNALRSESGEAIHIGQCNKNDDFPFCNKANYTQCVTPARAHLSKIKCYKNNKWFENEKLNAQNCETKEEKLERKLKFFNKEWEKFKSEMKKKRQEELKNARLKKKLLGNVCTKGDVKIEDGYAYIFEESWEPICGHFFWDNDVGATEFCKILTNTKDAKGEAKKFKVDEKDFDKEGSKRANSAKHIGTCEEPDDFPYTCNTNSYKGCDEKKSAHLTKIVCNGEELNEKQSCEGVQMNNEWIIYKNKNCYNNAGADQFEGEKRHTGDIEKCIEICENNSDCEGFVHDAKISTCELRKKIVIDKCHSDQSWNMYVSPNWREIQEGNTKKEKEKEEQQLKTSIEEYKKACTDLNMTSKEQNSRCEALQKELESLKKHRETENKLLKEENKLLKEENLKEKSEKESSIETIAKMLAKYTQEKLETTLWKQDMGEKITQEKLEKDSYVKQLAKVMVQFYVEKAKTECLKNEVADETAEKEYYTYTVFNMLEDIADLEKNQHDAQENAIELKYKNMKDNCEEKYEVLKKQLIEENYDLQVKLIQEEILRYIQGNEKSEKILKLQEEEQKSRNKDEKSLLELQNMEDRLNCMQENITDDYENLTDSDEKKLILSTNKFKDVDTDDDDQTRNEFNRLLELASENLQGITEVPSNRNIERKE